MSRPDLRSCRSHRVHLTRPNEPRQLNRTTVGSTVPRRSPVTPLFTGSRQSGGRPIEGTETGLEAHDRRHHLLHRRRPVVTIKNPQVRRLPDHDAVVRKTHQSRRAAGHQVELLFQATPVSHLADVGVRVDHSHQGTVHVGHERIENVAGGQRAVYRLQQQSVNPSNAPHDRTPLVSGPIR